MAIKKTKKTIKKTGTKPVKITVKPKKRTFEERLFSLDDDEAEYQAPVHNEALRHRLLKEEFKLRKKQPTAWTKTKYRKYALIFNKPKKPREKIAIQEERELKD
ncbi:MAG: hypothetical protein Q7R47_05355 [Candidatus Diapherotrites archaeon]|nr:hypothetical protein [Candidatus Diapherotrites archaeon]